MRNILILLTLFIANVSYAKYAHVRSRILDGAFLIFDKQEQQYLKSEFCVNKDHLLDQLKGYGFNLKDYQFNLLDDLFFDSDRLGVLYCENDDDPACQFLGYANYTQENVFILDH